MSHGAIAILASMGWGVRNVLMSRAMETIGRHRRVHVLSPFNHVPEFRRRFAALDGLEELEDFKATFRHDRITKRLYHLNLRMYYKLSPSSTHQHKVRSPKFRRFERESILNRLALRFSTDASYRMVRTLLIGRIRRSAHYRRLRAWYRERGITDVVTPTPYSIDEYPAIVAAADLGLRRTAIIHSWDNLTSKRPMIVEYDRYLVWNPVMADDVARFYDPGRTRTTEIGPLQFDYYFDDRFVGDREAFLRGLGLDPGRRTIVHSTVTPGLLPDEPDVVEKLLAALREGRVSGTPNLIVRLHPKRSFDDFRALSRDPRWAGLPVAWTAAGESVREGHDRWCPMDEEIRLLVNTVRHGDVNLNYFSTMLLDFAVAGRPVVLLAHDGTDNVLDYRRYEHLGPVLACAAQRIGHSFEETLAHLNHALDHPDADAAQRALLVERYGGAYLGRAWRRLAEVLLEDDARDQGSSSSSSSSDSIASITPRLGAPSAAAAGREGGTS